ncbi:MAG: hypothetical protein LBL35_02215 [Clostridiales bacterium]|jgi:galactitol-specific phosphotransferase system IIC component|nr:hypothetical protein [Clostridiales bacterium]
MEDFQPNEPSKPDFTPHYDKPAVSDASVMGFGDWLITLIILAIPCVNIIMLIVWAVSGSGNVNRRNFCRASLVVTVILSVLASILIATLGAAMFTLFSSAAYQNPTAVEELFEEYNDYYNDGIEY